MIAEEILGTKLTHAMQRVLTKYCVVKLYHYENSLPEIIEIGENSGFRGICNKFNLMLVKITYMHL